MLFTSNARIDSLDKPWRARIADQGWHLQLLCDVSHETMDGPVRRPAGAGGVRPFRASSGDQGRQRPRLPAMRRLLVRARPGLNCPAPTGSVRPAMQTDKAVAALAAALLAANPDHLVWGSDWPHPAIPQQHMPNDGALLDALATGSRTRRFASASWSTIRHGLRVR